MSELHLQNELQTRDSDSISRLSRPQNFMFSAVVPAFNEAANLPVLVEKISEIAAGFPNYEIIIVDDGSSDETVEVLDDLCSRNPRLRYLSLSRNYGHQAALRAGIDASRGDCIACLDADLQHPPELLREMVAIWQGGQDIVSCIRDEDRQLPFLKRTTSKGFYAVLNWMSGLQIEPGSSDFRLLDRVVVDVITRLPESDIFFRGLLPTLGFKSETLRYRPSARLHGETKYTLHKMMRLALNGVISTSIRPLRLATYFAFLTAAAAAGFLAYVLYIYFFTDTGVPGWASTLAVVLIIGSMQLLVLGAIGEYLGQVLRETRRRPPYIVRESGGRVSNDETTKDAKDAD